MRSNTGEHFQHTTISYLRHHDEEFEQEVLHYTELAHLDPHLCIYRLSGNSWRAAAELIEHLERRHGKLTTDQLLDALDLAIKKARDVTVR